MAKEAATIELIWDLMRGRTEGISRVDYVPQKPVFPEALPYEQPFPRTSPESQGIHSRQIEELFRELKASKELHMHNVMILKGGKSSERRLFILTGRSSGMQPIPCVKV